MDAEKVAINLLFFSLTKNMNKWQYQQTEREELSIQKSHDIAFMYRYNINDIINISMFQLLTFVPSLKYCLHNNSENQAKPSTDFVDSSYALSLGNIQVWAIVGAILASHFCRHLCLTIIYAYEGLENW